MNVLGVDIGGTSLRVASSLDAISSRPVPESYVDLLDAVVALGGRPDVVAVGLPGATDPAVPRWIPALSWLDGRPLAADLSARLGGAPVTLANDAQLALLAEVRLGAARGVSNAVLVSVGTGIGGAILLDGRIVRGAHGTAGSFGWLPAASSAAAPDHGGFEPAAPSPPDSTAPDHGGFEPAAPSRPPHPTAPDHGGFELAASGRALDAAAGPGRMGRDLVAASRRGDAAARAALDAWAGALGTGIAAIASILDPERVVLSGGLSEAFDAYAEPLRTAVRRAGSPDARDVPIVPAALGAHAGVIGALCAALGEGL